MENIFFYKTKRLLNEKILRYIMVFIQIDLPEDVNEQLKILKIKRKDTTIQETASYVLNKYVPVEEKNGCN